MINELLLLQVLIVHCQLTLTFRVDLQDLFLYNNNVQPIAIYVIISNIQIKMNQNGFLTFGKTAGGVDESVLHRTWKHIRQRKVWELWVYYAKLNVQSIGI